MKNKLESKEILKEVRANRKRLESCKRPHDFSYTKPTLVSSYLVCTLCKGEISEISSIWYKKGLEDG